MEIEVEAKNEIEAVLKAKDRAGEYNRPGFWVDNKKFDDWWVEDEELQAHPIENGPITIDDILYLTEEDYQDLYGDKGTKEEEDEDVGE